MKVLVIGLGSIAKKHIAVLRSLVPDILIFALRSSTSGLDVEGVNNLYSWSNIPSDLDFIIISNSTSLHAETILNAIDLEVPLFIEKPILHSLDRSVEIVNKVIDEGIISYVACNLRFHPAIKLLKEETERFTPIEYNSYCGSYLPEWRNTDYRNVYSSIKSLGGGVHLDLIHEIDYCMYILGVPNAHYNYFRKKSNLEIDSVDIAHYILEYDKTSAFITLNYYRRQAKRVIDCVWEDKVWRVNLLNNSITDGNGEIIYSEYIDGKYTYTQQMKYFLNHLENRKMPSNNIVAGLKTLKIALNE